MTEISLKRDQLIAIMAAIIFTTEGTDEKGAVYASRRILANVELQELDQARQQART